MLELMAAVTLLGAQDGPSFDCTRAFEPVENAICTDRELASLDQRMADRYAQVRRALWPEARSALQQDQRWFLGARDEWFENRDRWADFPDLAARYQGRIEALDAIDTVRRNDPVGVWRTVAGFVEIRRTGSGRLQVSMNAANPTNARWLCDLEFAAREDGATIVTSADLDENVRISLRVRQGVLEVEESRTGTGFGGPAYCGANGSLSGLYLRTR